MDTAPAPPRLAPLPQSEYAGLRAGAMNARDEFGRAPDEWRGVGGGPRSLAQMQQDLYARGLMNAEQDQIQHGIDEAEMRRGDPMRDQIEARAKDLAYERLTPAGSTSRVHAIDRGVDRYGAGEGMKLGGLTTGEQNEIEQSERRARLSADFQSGELSKQYAEGVRAMRQDALDHPEHRADLEKRLQDAERDYTRELARLGAKNIYDYKPKPRDPLADIPE